MEVAWKVDIRQLVGGRKWTCLTDDVTAAVDDAAPQLARLVPAGVAGVGAEHQQERQRKGRQAERVVGHHRDGPAHSVAAESTRGSHVSAVFLARLDTPKYVMNTLWASANMA